MIQRLFIKITKQKMTLPEEFADKGNGTSQPLHFQATLKQDGNIAIEPGILKPPALFRLPTPDNTIAPPDNGGAIRINHCPHQCD